jgi:hypothetical protein
MARKTTRRVAASKGKKSPPAKGRKSAATKRASAGRRKSVSVESFVRSIRTLHDLKLIQPFLRSAKINKLTLTMDTAALERVKSSVDKPRKAALSSAELKKSVGSNAHTALSGPGVRGISPPPDNDPFDFASNAGAPGGLGGVRPLPGHDPFDF